MAPSITISSLSLLDVGDRSHCFIKPSETCIDGIIAHMTTGSVLSIAVAYLPEDAESTTAVSVLSTLMRLGAMDTQPVRENNISQAYGEAKEQVSALRERLTQFSLDGATRKRLEKELQEKEQRYHELDQIFTSSQRIAAAAFEIRRLSQAKEENDTKIESVSLKLSNEKKKRFAATFRMAFSKAKGLAGAQNVEVNRELEGQALALKHELIAASNERDRLAYANRQLSKDLELVRTTLMDVQSESIRTKRALVEANEQTAILERKLAQAEFAATDKRHDAIQSLADVERKNDKLSMQIRLTTKELEDANRMIAALKKDMESIVTQKVNEAEERVLSMRVQLNAAYIKQQTAEEKSEKLSAQIQRFEEKISRLSAQLSEKEMELGTLQHAVHNRVSVAKEMHIIERENYKRMVREGQCYLEELRNLVMMAMPAHVSAYRGGAEEVAAFLTNLHLGGLVSTFLHHGFNTMHAVSLIKEADLVEMQVISGSRRKLLAAVNELDQLYKKAFNQSTALFPWAEDAASAVERQAAPNGSAPSTQQREQSPTARAPHPFGVGNPNQHFDTPVTLNRVLGDFSDWLADFHALIEEEERAGSGF
jgi:hypothetical protein